MGKSSKPLPREADRKKIPLSIRHQLLTEAGYRCGNPSCSHVITLDIHHIQYVSDAGGDDPTNLLVLCPNCHSLHHAGHIPVEAVKFWKGLLSALNQAFGRQDRDLLLYLWHTKGKDIWYSGDGLLQFAPLVAADLVTFRVEELHAPIPPKPIHPKDSPFKLMMRYEPNQYVAGQKVYIELTPKGVLLVEAWVSGNERQFRELISTPTGSGHPSPPDKSTPTQ